MLRNGDEDSLAAFRGATVSVANNVMENNGGHGVFLGFNATVRIEDKLAFSTEESAEIAPFRVVNFTGGLCDSGGNQSSSRPKILIDNSGLDNFVVTSIMIKTSGVGVEDSVQLSIESLSINGFEFDTPTGYQVGSSGNDSEQESADHMGTPVRLGFAGSTGSSGPGGNFPHQIVAAPNTDGADIEVTLFCNSNSTDFSILAISVGGWKYEDDIVTVTYIPGK